MLPRDAEHQDHAEGARAFLRSQLAPLIGLEDTSAIELAMHIRGLTRLYELAESQRFTDVDLSGPRWGLLLFLLAQERLGNDKGMTPTALSRFQGVSRNTISSLLRGLEAQGYIERALDAEDRRLFRIRLTEAGREVIEQLAPTRVAFINQLASGLNGKEREQLIALLGKLRRSLLRNADLCTAGIHDC